MVWTRITLLYELFKTYVNETRLTGMLLAGNAQTVQGQATAWLVRGSNTCSDEVFRTSRDGLWGPHSPL